MKKSSLFKNVIKELGIINEAIYGVNPYENIDEVEEEKRSDLAELNKDNFYDR